MVYGHARLESPNLVSIDDDIKVEAEHVIIAVGSRPYRPEVVDFEHPRISTAIRFWVWMKSRIH